LEIIIDLPFGFPINNIISLEREAATESRDRNSTKNAAEEQRWRTETEFQRKMQCTYVMLVMFAKTPTANDLMFWPLRSRRLEVVEQDPDDDKTASLYIRIYAKPFTHTR